MLSQSRLNNVDVLHIVHTNVREQILGILSIRFDSIDLPAPNEAREEEGVKTRLSTNIVDRHTNSDKTLQSPLLLQFICAKPATMGGTSSNPLHALGRAM